MSAVQVRIEERRWSPAAGVERLSRPRGSNRKQVLAALSAVFLACVDVLLVAIAFTVAFQVRFSVDESAVPLDPQIYVRPVLVASFLMVVLLATHGLYDLERPQSWAVRLRAIASSSSTALVLAVTASYFLGDQALSRLWLASGWVLSIAAVALWRAVSHRLYERARQMLGSSNRVLVVGANRLGRELADELQPTCLVVGYVDNGSDLEHLERPLLGSIAQLEELVHAYTVDQLVIALPASRREQIMRVLARGFGRQVQVKLLPDAHDMLQGNFEIQMLGGRRYIGFVPAAAAASWAKRAVDLALVSIGLLAISPLLLIIAIAIKLDSRGPVFYSQQRVGKDGRYFSMLKFRSMCQDADRRLEALRRHNEATGPLFKMRRDPRVTRVGRMLRRWSLDELPQLFNVLRGEMSLVGPRPPIPSEVEQYEDWQLGRLRAVPGLTGLWQVSGRSEVPFLDMVRLDLHYIRNWSLGLDLEILLRTIPAVLTNRGAY
jgi:exopolysaccharide biosynthesis polyprenyl glycosylphosphotransferase